MKSASHSHWRLNVIRGLLVLGALALVGRAVDLHVLDHDFLASQGNARHLRVVEIAAHRGMLTDRLGEPLAISTPVESVWVNPQELINARDRWPALAGALDIELGDLERLIASRRDREFVYLRRHVDPELGEAVLALKIPGVSTQREFRRYYPAGEVTAHVVGFTNVDDRGQEGMELALDDILGGTPGSKRVLKDRIGRVVEDVESISEPRPGRDIALSIDKRIQYLAYRELMAAVQRHRAKSGSAVVIDIRTGEVLAMVNQPSYNPNNRRDLDSRRYRNRAVTDLFEPGSTIKPFTVSAALESGRYQPDTLIETGSGQLKLANFTIRDTHDYGTIDVATVLKKSSNVGAAKIGMSLEPRTLWDIYSRVGFGFDSGSGFPGEAAGLLKHYREWHEVDQAAISYGYGLSVTPLQLTHGYAALANHGRLTAISFLKRPADQEIDSISVIEPKVAATVMSMLEGVVQAGGTATRAAVPGYRVAGKTGTVRKLGKEGYSEEHYRSVFVGMVPASNPRLAMAVIVDEPDNGVYYGGLVAAPVFANVMADALRLLDIAPDALPTNRLTMAEAKL